MNLGQSKWVREAKSYVFAEDGTDTAYTLGSGNRLSSWGASGSMDYDTAGNATNIVYEDGRELDIEYDGLYRVTAVYTNGMLAEEYGYDASGRRAWIASGGTTNYMVYDGEDLVAEVDSNGDPVRSYVHGPGIDNLLAITTYGAETNTYYALTDHLGSVTALADDTGAIVESYEYDAWGKITVYDENGQQIPMSGIGNRFTFQGREYSWSTGLYNFRARWYDPVTGRWLSKDPIGISGGLNQYVFCGNNPVNFVDPWGLCAETITDEELLELLQDFFDTHLKHLDVSWNPWINYQNSSSLWQTWDIPKFHLVTKDTTFIYNGKEYPANAPNYIGVGAAMRHMRVPSWLRTLPVYVYNIVSDSELTPGKLKFYNIGWKMYDQLDLGKKPRKSKPVPVHPEARRIMGGL